MIVSAIVLVLLCVAPGRGAGPHHRPVRCGRFSPRRELVCARRVLAVAVRHPPSRTRRYWRWREQLAHRWIRDARRRLAVPPAHSRFTPDPAAAAYWTRRYFGAGANYRLMMCVAYSESRYELSPPPNAYYGPWQVSKYWHPWVNTYRLTHSWRYAAAVSWHLSGYGTDFSAWHGDCGL